MTRISLNRKTDAVLTDETPINYMYILIDDQLYSINWRGVKPPTSHNSVYRTRLDKMLSYRRETALQGALQFSPKVKDWNWETIFYGHYRSIFNHCDIISLKICRIP